MDMFRKGIAAADGVIRRTGQNLMDDQPGPAAGASRGRATPGGRAQAGSPGLSTPQRTPAPGGSLMDSDVVFHTPQTSAPAAAGTSVDLSALAEMLRIDITARCASRGWWEEGLQCCANALLLAPSLRDELHAELAVARAEAASASERAARAEAAVAELVARGSGRGAIPAQSGGADGDGRTEWHDKVERALQVLMDRVIDAGGRAQAAEQAAAQALALAESGVARPPPLGREQQVQLPPEGPYASEEMVFSALAGMQSNVERAHAVAAQALAMTDALRASQAAPPPSAPAPAPAEATLRHEDAARLAVLEEAMAGMAPRDKVSAALKKLNGDITAASDAAADAVRRISALESAAAATEGQGTAAAAAASAASAQLAAVSQVQASLAAVQEELSVSAANLAAVRGDVEALRLQQQQMAASAAAAPAPPQAVIIEAAQAQPEEEDKLDELSVGSAPEAAFVADAGALEDEPSPELATAVAVSDVQASLSALESRVEQLASDWGLGIIATQAATADAPVNARTLAELNASVLVMEARLEEIATDWGMASLMSAQSSAAMEKRLVDVEAALKNAPDVASALGIITPRVKQLEAAVSALKAAAGEAATAAGEAGAVAASALALSREAASVAARAQPAGEHPTGGLLTQDDVAAAVEAAVEPLGDEISRLQGVVSSATATVSSCCNDLARVMDAVERVTQQVGAVEAAERQAREAVLAHVKETETSVWQSVVLMRDAVAAAASPAPGDGQAGRRGDVTPPPRPGASPRTPALTHATPSGTAGRSPQRGWLGARTPERQ